MGQQRSRNNHRQNKPSIIKELSQEEIHKIIKGCLYSGLYYKQNIKVSEIQFDYNGFTSDYGIELKNENGSHQFGLKVVDSFKRGKLVDVHYVRMGATRGALYSKTIKINPKRISASKLLKISGLK